MDKKPETSQLLAALYQFLLECFVILPISTYFVVIPLLKLRGFESKFPSITAIFFETVFSLLLTDFLFYWFHRSLHSKWLYQSVHKQHHEFTITRSISAEYSAPLETISNIITVIAGPFILRSHIFIYCLVAGLRLWESLDCHSGYDLPWYLSPWSLIRSTRQHDFHHSKNIGSYGMFAFWDHICGTNDAYYAWRQKKNCNMR